MVSDERCRRTTQKFLATAEPSDGFTELWRFHRLDLTMENLVLKLKYRPLFSDQEIEIARERLASFGFSSREK
jgi:hypothetical protein